MLLPGYLKKHPVKEKLLKLSTGGTCENCSTTFPLALLAIHVIGRPPDIESGSRDLQKHLLVLCPGCLRSFRSGNAADSQQRELVRYRSAEVRKAMRAVLGYRPGKYVPPGDFDLARIFADACESRAMDYCLNGG
jgi:hypothetical protein